MNWFRMYAEFATDPKVQMLPEALQRRLVMLFCIRCNSDVTLHDDEVTFSLRISSDEWAQTKAVFVAKGFIDSDNNLLNWDKRQYRSDSSAERVRRYRDKKKQDDVTQCNVTVTPQNRTEQIQNRTDTEKKTIEAEAAASPSLVKFVLPDWIPESVWGGFMEVRRVKKAANTIRAKELLVKQLDQLRQKGHDPTELLNTSIRNSWKDIWEPKENQHANDRRISRHQGFETQDYRAGTDGFIVA